MVEISIHGSSAVFEPLGMHKLWAFKRRLEFPLRNIRDVRLDASLVIGWWEGLRMPGTHIPGVIIAGTFYRGGERIFWDVRRPENAIVVEITNERYDRLIVEVADPAEALERIVSATRK